MGHSRRCAAEGSGRHLHVRCTATAGPALTLQKLAQLAGGVDPTLKFSREFRVGTRRDRGCLCFVRPEPPWTRARSPPPTQEELVQLSTSKS